MQELFIAFGFDQLVQDGFAAFAGEGDFLAVAFDPFFQPSGLFGIGDVHVLQREGAAIGAFDDLDDLAHLRGQVGEHVALQAAHHEGGAQALLVLDKTPQGVRQTLLEAVHFVPLKSGVA